jgi:hypothetical protein
LWQKALRLGAITAGADTRTQQHKSAEFADQIDGARAFKLMPRLLAYGTLTEFSVELCPNGNRLWCPNRPVSAPQEGIPRAWVSNSKTIEIAVALNVHWQVRVVIRPLLVFAKFDVSHGFSEALMLVGRLFHRSR